MASPGYRRWPQDTAYPQDTDSILRIPRYPQDTAGVLRYKWPQDAVVSSGYRVPRMPSVSQDANSRLQMVLVEFIVRGAEQVPDAVGDRARHLVVGERWLCRARAFSGGPTRSEREVQAVGLRHPNAWWGAALVDARARLPGYGMPRDT